MREWRNEAAAQVLETCSERSESSNLSSRTKFTGDLKHVQEKMLCPL